MNNELEQRIRERAYQLWEQDGCVHGRADAHWHAAVAEFTLLAEAAPATSLTAQEDIVVEAKPKAKRKSTKAAVEAVTPAPATRRRRSSTTPLAN